MVAVLEEGRYQTMNIESIIRKVKTENGTTDMEYPGFMNAVDQLVAWAEEQLSKQAESPASSSEGHAGTCRADQH